MSIALGRTMAYRGYTLYSHYHPDNLKPREQAPLPEPVKGPAPLASFSEIDVKVDGAWGHRLTCEKPFGPSETTTRIKATVDPKVGSSWAKTITVERGDSTSNSAMYGGSYVQMTCCQAANMVRLALSQGLNYPLCHTLRCVSLYPLSLPALQGVGSLKR